MSLAAVATLHLPHYAGSHKETPPGPAAASAHKGRPPAVVSNLTAWRVRGTEGTAAEAQVGLAHGVPQRPVKLPAGVGNLSEGLVRLAVVAQVQVMFEDARP